MDDLKLSSTGEVKTCKRSTIWQREVPKLCGYGRGHGCRGSGVVYRAAHLEPPRGAPLIFNSWRSALPATTTFWACSNLQPQGFIGLCPAGWPDGWRAASSRPAKVLTDPQCGTTSTTHAELTPNAAGPQGGKGKKRGARGLETEGKLGTDAALNGSRALWRFSCGEEGFRHSVRGGQASAGVRLHAAEDPEIAVGGQARSSAHGTPSTPTCIPRCFTFRPGGTCSAPPTRTQPLTYEGGHTPGRPFIHVDAPALFSARH